MDRAFISGNGPGQREDEDLLKDKKLSNHSLLHTLWTKAVGTKDYNKQEWKELESRLIKLTKYEAAEVKDK